MPAAPIVKRRVKTPTATVMLVLVVLAIVSLIPLSWMLFTSVRSPTQITQGVISWLPQPFTTENYTGIFSDPQDPIWRWFANSLFVAFSGTVLAVTIASMAAYAIARLALSGKNIVFMVLLASMLIPGILLVIPQYNEFANAIPNYSMIDTYWPLILP